MGKVALVVIVAVLFSLLLTGGRWRRPKPPPPTDTELICAYVGATVQRETTSSSATRARCSDGKSILITQADPDKWRGPDPATGEANYSPGKVLYVVGGTINFMARLDCIHNVVSCHTGTIFYCRNLKRVSVRPCCKSGMCSLDLFEGVDGVQECLEPWVTPTPSPEALDAEI
jgi:hypothetical protein